MNAIIISNNPLNAAQIAKARKALSLAVGKANVLSVANERGKCVAWLSGRLLPEDVRRAENAV